MRLLFLVHLPRAAAASAGRHWLPRSPATGELALLTALGPGLLGLLSKLPKVNSHVLAVLLFILFRTIPFICRTLSTCTSIIAFASHRHLKNCKMNFHSVHTVLELVSHRQENQSHSHKHSVKDIPAFCKYNGVVVFFSSVSSFSLCFFIMCFTLLESPSPGFIVCIPT